jgi:hypothetical protein
LSTYAPHLARSDETQSIVDALYLGIVELFTAAGIKLVTVAQCLDITPYEVVENINMEMAGQALYVSVHRARREDKMSASSPFSWEAAQDPARIDISPTRL